MAWRNDYDRQYSDSWYGAGWDEPNRRGRERERGRGWEEPWSGRGEYWEGARGPRGRGREESWEHRDARTPYWGPRGHRDHGYDYLFRRPPQESPAYGRGGDEQARRWARRYGYDEGFTIEPGRGGRGEGGAWSGGRGEGGAWGAGRGEGGAWGAGRGEGGAWGAGRGARDWQRYDWNYRW